MDKSTSFSRHFLKLTSLVVKKQWQYLLVLSIRMNLFRGIIPVIPWLPILTETLPFISFIVSFLVWGAVVLTASVLL